MKHKVFRYVVLLILFSILLTGCKEKKEPALTNQYGFQPPIDQLYWSMSLEDIEKTLSIQKDKDGVVYKRFDDGFTTIILPYKLKKFGYKATVYLDIVDKPNEKWFPYQSSYLIDIKLVYNDVDGQKLKKNMIKELNDPGNDYVDLRKNNCTTWKSQDKIKDIKPDVKKKLKEYWKAIDDHNIKLHPDLPKVASMVKEEDENINTINLDISTKENGAVVTYYGDNAVNINQANIDIFIRTKK